MTDYKKQGKKNRAAGVRFEAKVREDLKNSGWFVAKWTNNVEWLEENINKPSDKREGKLIPAKHKFRGPGIPMAIGTGFPDFIAFKNDTKVYNIIGEKPIIKTTMMGVEVKTNGYLTPDERDKLDWLLENKVFSTILIASKGTKRGEIIYNEFKHDK